MDISNLLAWRYLSGVNSKRALSTIALISFLSITIGAASLTLVTSIMNGFESVTKQKIQNISPQLISTTDIKDYKKLFNFDGIEFATPQSTENILISSENDSKIKFSDSAILKGVDPKGEALTTDLFSKFTNLIGPLELLNKEYVLVGKELAINKDIFPGDCIELCIPITTKKEKVSIKKLSVTVLGLIDTGINEYDNNLVVCSIETLQKLSDNFKTQIGLKIKDGYDLNKIQKTLAANGYYFDSWQDLYPALSSALKLEKYATFIVLALILLVATINLIALIFMIITQKKRDIAILKAMGLPLKKIRKIFIIFGYILVTSATSMGLFIAWLAGLAIERYPFIELPDVYYTTTLPIKMTLPIFASVFILTFLFGTIAIAAALQELKTLNPIRTLKFEI